MFDSKKPLLSNKNEIIWMYYSGFQAGYTLKRMHQESEHKYTYYGPELRYTYRTLHDISTRVVQKSDTTIGSIQTIKGVNSTLTASFLFGQLYRYGLFYYEIYTGAGVGYKWLDGIPDPKVFDIRNEVIKNNRWNKPFIIARLGIRIGLAL
jgi:hypothetical protein